MLPSFLFTVENDPSALRADVAGKLAKRLVDDGAHVIAGQAFAEVEVMKMFMPLKVGEGGAGVVRWSLTEGAALAPGDLIATVTLDAPDAVRRLALFPGPLTLEAVAPGAAPLAPGGGATPTASAASLDYAAAPNAQKSHVRMRRAIATLGCVLQGYAVPPDQVASAMDDLALALADRLLPLYEFEESLSVLSGRLAPAVFAQLKGAADRYREQVSALGPACPEFALCDVLPTLDSHGRSLPEDDRAAFMSQVEALRNIAEQYSSGIAGRTVAALLTLVRNYLSVERDFVGVSMHEAWTCLRRRYPADLDRVFAACQSHNALSQKNQLLIGILSHVRQAAEATHAHHVAPPHEPLQPPAATDAAAASTSDAAAAAVPMTLSRILGQLGGGADIGAFIPVLTELAGLNDKAYTTVALEARKLLIEQSLPSRSQVTTGRFDLIEQSLPVTSHRAVAPLPSGARRWRRRSTSRSPVTTRSSRARAAHSLALSSTAARSVTCS